MSLASQINELGRMAQERKHLAAARVLYAGASALAPRWSVPWFNRGLIAKFERRWIDCRDYNRRASELDPDDPPAWWNLGIAATALQDWETARMAWSRYGITVPEGNGPIDMKLGSVPIRVSPDLKPEVVWCDRIDPARAVIRSVPLPDSRRGYGDILLHDGEVKGHRRHRGHEVPVFDELQVLQPGEWPTYEVSIAAPSRDDVARLQDVSSDAHVVVEDWGSSVRWLCQQCSEGTPHEHDHQDPAAEPWQTDRVVGVAALSEPAVRASLQAWARDGAGRGLRSIRCVLPRT